MSNKEPACEFCGPMTMTKEQMTEIEKLTIRDIRRNTAGQNCILFNSLLAEVRELRRSDALAKWAAMLLDDVWLGEWGDFDGGDAWEKALETGVLVRYEGPKHEDCGACADGECYVYAPDVAARLAAAAEIAGDSNGS